MAGTWRAHPTPNSDSCRRNPQQPGPSAHSKVKGFRLSRLSWGSPFATLNTS